MKIVDRYLLRQFVWTFLICFLSLTGIYIVFDAFTNLEEFINCVDKQGDGEESWFEHTASVMKLMGTYYGFKSIDCFDRLAGLLTLIAAMFTVTWIQRHNEMTALMSAGISQVRVVAPVVGAAAMIALLAAANRELLMPNFREQLARRPQDLTGRVGQTLTPRYDNRTDVLIGGEATYGDVKRIGNPSFVLPPGLDTYGKLLLAKHALFLPPKGGRPSGYILKGVEEPRALLAEPSLTLEGRPVIITPQDARWLQADECFVVSDVTFEQLASRQAWRQFSSTADLIAGLHNPSLDFGAEVRVTIHSRFVRPLLDVTLLFLGLPLVLRRGDRNVFIAIGLCAAVVAVCMIFVIVFEHLGSMYAISPALAAWAPLMIFLPAAVGMSEPIWR